MKTKPAWLQDREEEYVRRILEYYPTALKNVESKGFSILADCARGKERIHIPGEEKEIIAKLHAIESIAIENSLKTDSQEVKFLLNSKLIELLHLMIDREWLPEYFRDFTNVHVSFVMKLNLTLSGKNVADFNSILDFAYPLYTLRGYFKSTDKNRDRKHVLKFIITDALKLWLHALKSLHPSLEIWKDVNHLILPLNPNTWPIRIPGWLGKKKMERLSYEEGKRVIIHDLINKSVEFFRLRKEGESEEKIRNEHEPPSY